MFALQGRRIPVAPPARRRTPLVGVPVQVLLLLFLVPLLQPTVAVVPTEAFPLVVPIATTTTPFVSRRLYFSENDDDREGGESKNDTSKNNNNNNMSSSRRWENLNPQIKARLVQAGQERAVANKAKREPLMDKKRRRLQFMLEQQRTKKQAARVIRPLPLKDRAPLSAFLPGMQCPGIVISLTDFGAYVDVGTEVDGLLHVSQLSVDDFITHPRQLLTPGQELTVTVRARDAQRQKLQLTLLPPAVVQEQLQRQQQQQKEQLLLRADDDDDENNNNDRIALRDIDVDDELWGELKRVTNFGAYVEVGAVVDGFLHFMDHPDFVGGGQHPTDFMRPGDRVRVWVSDVDRDRQRIKLTAWRPTHLPGPRREWHS